MRVYRQMRAILDIWLTALKIFTSLARIWRRMA